LHDVYGTTQWPDTQARSESAEQQSAVVVQVSPMALPFM
jgi:hypothetical protein